MGTVESTTSTVFKIGPATADVTKHVISYTSDKQRAEKVAEIMGNCMDLDCEEIDDALVFSSENGFYDFHEPMNDWFQPLRGPVAILCDGDKDDILPYILGKRSSIQAATEERSFVISNMDGSSTKVSGTTLGEEIRSATANFRVRVLEKLKFVSAR